MNVQLGDALADLGAVPIFDGPEVSCPVCCGSLEQLALALDLEGLTPASCHTCGAILAA